MNPEAQWLTIGSMVLCGLGIGLAFDAYRIVCRRFRIPRWLLPAFDVAFWAAATVAVFRVLLDRNEGELRMYVFLGIGIGVTGYFGLFSPWIVKLLNRLLDGLIGVARLAWRIARALLIVPFLWIVSALAKLIDIVFVITASLLLWILRLLMKLLSPLARWLWKLLLPVRVRLRPVRSAWRRLRDRTIAIARKIAEAFRSKT